MWLLQSPYCKRHSFSASSQFYGNVATSSHLDDDSIGQGLVKDGGAHFFVTEGARIHLPEAQANQRLANEPVLLGTLVV